MLKSIGLANIRGATEVNLFLLNISNPQTYRPLLKEVSKAVVDAIKKKTDSGLDYQQRPFAPYCDAYRKWKKNKGYPDIVNLRKSGLMMDSLTATESGPNAVRIHMDNDKAALLAEYNQYNPPRRVFIGLSNEDLTMIDNMVDSFIKKLVKSL